MAPLRLSGALLCITLFVLSAYSTGAIGLRPGRVDMNYMPGFEKTFPYHVTNTMNIPITAEIETFYENGAYLGSFTVSKTEFELGPFETQPFFVTLKLPENSETPGESRIGISAYERDRKARRGAVVVQGAVASVFHINGLYHGKFLDLTLSAAVGGDGEPIGFVLSAKNLGTDTIENFRGRVEVYLVPENTLFTALDAVRDGEGPIASWYGTSFTAEMPSAGLRKGLYRAVGTVYYDGQQKQVETYFRIGVQGMKIVDFPKQAVAGDILRFPITVESEYNLPYTGVVATVVLKDLETLQVVRSFKTTATDVPPFAKQDLLGYLDLQGVDLGAYRINILVRYGDELTGADAEFKVTDANGNIYRAERSGGFGVQEAPRKPIFTTTNILIAAIVLLITLNIVWFLHGHRRDPPGPAAPIQSAPSQPTEQKSVNQ